MGLLARGFALLGIVVLCTGCTDAAGDNGTGGGNSSDSSNSSSSGVGGGPTTSSSTSAGGIGGSSPHGGSTPQPDGCLENTLPGDHLYHCDGLDYDVRIPDTCAPEGCGLNVDVHGLSMSAQIQEANTQLRQLGTARGFVVAQPNATPPPPNASWDGPIDDPKIYAFMTQAINLLQIDANRVHFTGFSQGGFMTLRFICAHADLLASAAPAAAAADCTFSGADMPSRELPLLFLNGYYDDNIVPFFEAEKIWNAVKSAWNATLEQTVSSDSMHSWTRYRTAAGTPVEFILHDYESSAIFPWGWGELKGHCFPGSDDPGTAPGQVVSFACEDTAAFQWGQAVVDFFETNPRRYFRQ